MLPFLSFSFSSFSTKRAFTLTNSSFIFTTTTTTFPTSPTLHLHLPPPPSPLKPPQLQYTTISLHLLQTSTTAPSSCEDRPLLLDWGRASLRWIHLRNIVRRVFFLAKTWITCIFNQQNHNTQKWILHSVYSLISRLDPIISRLSSLIVDYLLIPSRLSSWNAAFFLQTRLY